MESVGIDYHVNMMRAEKHLEVMPAEETIFTSKL